jgi:Mg2+ and Co2+ transporter CorA
MKSVAIDSTTRKIPSGDAPESPGFALVLDGQGGARRTFLDAGLERQVRQGALWVHLDYQNPRSRDWLAHHAGLCLPDREALLRPVTETRVEAVDGERLLLALLVSVPGAPELRSLRAVLAPDHAITFFRGPLPVLEAALDALRTGQGPRTVAELLTRVLEETCSQVERCRLRLDQELSELEWKVEGPSPAVFKRLALLRRAAAQARRGLGRQRVALGRLAGAAAPWLLDEHIDQWRELANRTDDLVAGLDDIGEGLQAVGEDLRTRLSSTIHQRLGLLTVLSSIALPLLVLGHFLGLGGH